MISMDKKMRIKVIECLSKNLKDEEKEIIRKLVGNSDEPENSNNNMGIETFNYMYLEVKENQNRIEEYEKILEFLREYKIYYARKNGLDVEKIKINFINYGKTELVYVLTEENNSRVTLLVKQPAVKFGTVHQEMTNLLELKESDKNVIAPIDYFKNENYELYVTPYINQARCVASYGEWGMYIPEPFYRFEPFTREQEKIVNTCMIAKLVSYYDFSKNQGIAKCKIGGGDFMLPKDWELETPTIENTLDNLYFIAAREKINCTFEEYLYILISEFSKSTINENQDNLIINLRGRVAMNIEDIENGIFLGKKVIEAKQGNQSYKQYKIY